MIKKSFKNTTRHEIWDCTNSTTTYPYKTFKTPLNNNTKSSTTRQVVDKQGGLPILHRPHKLYQDQPTTLLLRKPLEKILMIKFQKFGCLGIFSETAH